MIENRPMQINGRLFLIASCKVVSRLTSMIITEILTELFERLFQRLCEQLGKDYGPCIIHMDGAKYHVRREDAKPTSNSSKKEIVQWHQKNGYQLPDGPTPNKKPTLSQLREHLKTIDHEPTIITYEIARKHGHTILKTPPYHCELQPIEKVWAIVKNRIAASPEIGATALTLRNRLLTEFTKITSSQLRSVWKHTVDRCKGYLRMHEESLAETNEDDHGIDEAASDYEQ